MGRFLAVLVTLGALILLGALVCVSMLGDFTGAGDTRRLQAAQAAAAAAAAQAQAAQAQAQAAQASAQAQAVQAVALGSALPVVALIVCLSLLGGLALTLAFFLLAGATVARSSAGDRRQNAPVLLPAPRERAITGNVSGDTWAASGPAWMVHSGAGGGSSGAGFRYVE